MSNRKLINEIERTLKKVNEGLETFHGTLQKLDAAQTQAQKDKIEVELKKEIKKLQRLRDLIKGWQAGNEIKDKSALTQARRAIEGEMEKFKLLEKELKIKAYSREGLEQETKLDPEQRERAEIAEWINASVLKLGTQQDAMEAELEAALLLKSKQRDQPRIERLHELLFMHKLHIRRLEQLLRFLENDRIGVEPIQEIREDIDYYVEESLEDVDFVVDETLWDDFEDLSDGGVGEIGSLVAGGGSTMLDSVISATPATSDAPAAAAPTSTVTTDAARPSTATAIPPAPTPAKVKKSTAPTATPLKSTPPIVPAKKLPSFASAITANAPPTANTNVNTVNSNNNNTNNNNNNNNNSNIADENPYYSQLSALIQEKCKRPPPTSTLVDDDGSVACKRQWKLEMLTNSHDNMPDDTTPFPITATASNGSGHKMSAGNSNYPASIPAILSSPSLYTRLDLDTLFFIFYTHLPTPTHQYLAARTLKQQSWRYHTKYLTWFQRHEEPRRLKGDHEHGTFIYFDYEGGWCQRKKSEFTFEYKYLEDEPTV